MSFEIYIDRVLSHEGGYVNDPQDPGGETKFGICKRSYPKVDIKALTRQQAIDIYRQDFWLRVHGHLLPKEVAFQALDAAVNHGVGNAVRWLQRAAGVADDGIVGKITLKAIEEVHPDDMVLLFNAERIEFYCKLSTFARFGRGWMRRVAGNLRAAALDN